MNRISNRLKQIINNHPQWFVTSFFVAFFVVGLMIYHDYGLTFDTVHQKLIGEASFNYIFHHDTTLFSSMDKEYGSAFELLITCLYTLFGLSTDIQIYYFRHLVIFCTFFTGTVFFYRLIQLRFNSWKVGLLGAALLILSPRIFDSAFVNSKDIPLMVFFIISTFTLIKLDERMRIQDAIFHGLVTGFMIAIRPIGVLMLGLTGLIWLIKLVIALRSNRKIIIRYVFVLVSFLVATLGFTILWWPWLWPDPVGNFIYSFSSFSQYTTWKGTVLYIGKLYNPTELPWHYTPVWILVTTPLLYSFFTLVGMADYFIRAVGKHIRLSQMNDRIDLILVCWFTLPLVMVAVMHSVLYSGWRHMFFIYPAMLALSVSGLIAMIHWLKAEFSSKLPQIILQCAVLASLTGTVVAMVFNHPYESMYFNILAGRNTRSAKYRYGLDFYGLCAKEALDYVLENATQEPIDILPNISVVMRSAYLVPLSERERIRWVGDLNLADYFVGAYTDQREEFVLPDNYRLVYSVERGGADLCVVYQNRDDH